MTTNDPSFQAAVIKPTASVKFNGAVVDWLSIDIVSTNNRRASTFEIKIPTFAQTNMSFEDIIATEVIDVAIDMDAGDGEFVRLLTGRVDMFEERFVSEDAIFTGRDLTALLIDTKTTQKFVEVTSSTVASLFAEEHGLKEDIQSTDTPVGTYYNNQSVSLNSQTTEWDLLSFLAQNEGFDLYVDNKTLVFKAPSTTKDYYVIDWRAGDSNAYRFSNAIEADFSRNLTIANDVRVTVKSWKALDQKTHTATSSRKHSPSRIGAKQSSQKYVAFVPGLSADQTTKLAQQTALDISLHEKNILATLQADTILTPRSIIKVTGFSTAWDQLYYPDNIHRHLSFKEKFTMEVRAKNHDVNSQVVL